MNLGSSNSRVLVTSGHSRMGLNVARCLIANGYSVTGFGLHSFGMCRFLPGIESYVSHVDPFEAPAEYIESLLAAAKRYRCNQILPVHEEIFVISEYKRYLEGADLKVLSPDLDTLKLLHDKANIPIFARDANVPYPKTFLPQLVEDLDAARDALGYPFIIKPRWSSGAMGVKCVDNDAKFTAVRSIWAERPPRGTFLVQQFVPGAGAGVGILVRNSQIIAKSGHLRVREIPLSGGTSCARITLQNNRVLEAAASLIQRSKLPDGVCMVEFRVDSSSGRYWVLEINPRYWGGVSAEIESGTKYPVLQVSDETGVSRQELCETRWLLGEFRAASELLRNGRLADLIDMFSVAEGHRLYIEDFGPGRYASFISQVLTYGLSLVKHGNLGQHSTSKDSYFTKLMARDSPHYGQV